VDTQEIDILSAVLAPQAQLAKGKVSDRSIVGAFYIHRHFIVKWYTSSERGVAQLTSACIRHTARLPQTSP
jgi:hypothetical protein